MASVTGGWWLFSLQYVCSGAHLLEIGIYLFVLSVGQSVSKGGRVHVTG